MSILQFDDDNFRWLSNFFPVEFVWDGIIWPTSEHAFQAAKVLDRQKRIELSTIKNPGKIKRIGKTLPLREDWNQIRVSIMKDVVRCKFKQNPELLAKLIATGSERIEEGNTWRDTFWGICPPGSDQGMNHLGEILMELREEFKQDE